MAYFDPSDQSITIESATPITTDPQKALVEEVKAEEGLRVKRRVVDTITMSHEVSHAIYEKLSGKQLEHVPEDYTETADQAINEGFAIFTQLLYTDRLKSNPQILNLDEKDIVDLDRYKMATLRTVRRMKDGNTEGAFRILHRVFEQAAGPPSQRDVRKGLAAIRKFIGGIDRERTLRISRSDPEYRRLLEEGTPEQFSKFFSSGEASA